MSALSGPQDGAWLADAPDVQDEEKCEHAANGGASSRRRDATLGRQVDALDHDVRVRFRRRLSRLATLHRQIAQVVENLAEDAETLLDVRRDLSPVRDVDEPEEIAPAKPASPALLGVPELAELLAVDAATVRRWRREKRLPPALVVGSTVRWRHEDIDAWIVENREATR